MRYTYKYIEDFFKDFEAQKIVIDMTNICKERDRATSLELLICAFMEFANLKPWTCESFRKYFMGRYEHRNAYRYLIIGTDTDDTDKLFSGTDREERHSIGVDLLLNLYVSGKTSSKGADIDGIF